MKLIEMFGFLIAISAILWPIKHRFHNCQKRSEWEDSICPTAQLMELAMFLQIGIGFLFIALGAP